MKRAAGLLLLPLLLSCEDSLDKLYPETPPVQLPAATQAGVNTFGCRLNGQVWEANNTRTLAGKVITPTAHYRHGALRIDAFRRLQVLGPITNFRFTVGPVTGPGVYKLGPAEPQSGGHAQLKTSAGALAYATDAQQPGTLTITRLDTTGPHPFVAGRFELLARARADSAGFPASLRITEGRFDIQLSR